jgi:hypothetical protein
MRLLVLGLASLLASCASVPEQPSCAVKELLAATSNRPSASPQALWSVRPESLRAISVQESAIGNDLYRYSAVVDPSSKQVWVYRYGGIAGHIAWFGPVLMPLERTAACGPSRGIILLGNGTMLLGRQE